MVLKFRPILKYNSYRTVSLGTGYLLTQNKNREKEKIKVKHSEVMEKKSFKLSRDSLFINERYATITSKASTI